MGKASFALVFLVAASAHAQVVATLDVRGECPDASAVRNATVGLIREPAGTETAPYVVRVEGEPGRARMELARASGPLVIEREIDSTDCAALAQAFALVLYAQFIELHELAPETPPPVATALTQPQEGAANQPQPAAPPARASTSPPAPAPRPSPAPLRRVAPRSSHRAILSLGALVGPSIAIAPSSISVRAGGEAVFFAPRLPLGARVLAAYETPYSEGQSTTRIETRAWLGAVDLLYRLHFGRAFALLGAGVAAMRATASAPDWPGSPSAARWVLMARVVPAIGIQIAGPLWACFDVPIEPLIVGDRYEIVPDGEVARSPSVRVTPTFTFGLDLIR